MYSITPCNIVTTKTITSFKIDRIEISLFQSAVITVVLLDSANSILDVKFINMTNTDYSKWSADDSYVIEFIKQNLGFSDVSVEPVSLHVSEEPVSEEPVSQEEPVSEEPVSQVSEEPVSQEPVSQEPVSQEEPQTDE
jgi:hypothetical protein